MAAGRFEGPEGPGPFDRSHRGRPRGGRGKGWQARGARGIGANLAGPFGPLGPFGPFSPLRRRGAWKYIVALGLARIAAEGVMRGAGATGGRTGASRARRVNPWASRTWPVNPWSRVQPPPPSNWSTLLQLDDLQRQRLRRARRVLLRLRPTLAPVDRAKPASPGFGARSAVPKSPIIEIDAHDGNNEDKDEEGWMPRFDRGPGSGPGGPRGPHDRRPDRGDVKYLLLDLLREGPRHGYDMIKELEKRSGGFYAPSPGSVYPTLQLLEDQGFVTSTTVDGKRTYRLTDAGYAFGEERAERTDNARERSWTADPSDTIRDELRSIGKDAGEMARSLRDAVRMRAPDSRQLNEIRDVLGEARRRVEAILAERREGMHDDHPAPRPHEGDGPTTV